ncbi:MAG: hypothetical protein ABIH69_06045, partial [bacterium]
EILELIFPKGTFEWFEITDGKRDEDDKPTHITLTEKDIPPLTEENKNKKILARKFYNITITDFPLRGRQTLLTFRGRYWKLEGQDEYLKRDIKLAFAGTQLEQEFALFLKGYRGGRSNLAGSDSAGPEDSC